MAEIKDFLDIAVWNVIQEKISSNLNIQLKIIDINGNTVTSSSNTAFYCKLMKNNLDGSILCKQSYKFFLNKVIKENKEYIEFECKNGLINIIYPIVIRNNIVGGIVAGCFKKELENDFFSKLSKKIKIGSDELRDEYSNISFKNHDTYKKTIKVISQTVPELININYINKKRVGALSMLKDISNLLNSTLNIKQIMTEIIRFIIEHKFAETCSVVTMKPLKRYTSNEAALPKHYTNFESKIINEIIRDRKIRGIANISKDKRFNSKSNLQLYNAMISMPIINNLEVVGVINIYSSSIDKLKQNIEFFSIVANQASIAISNANQYEKMKYSAVTDKLTGLYNRRYFMDVLEQEIARSKRFGHPISVAMIDIDHFKHYNDRNGHPQGDVLLQELSQVLKDTVRDVDTVGRYGGEEFIIVFPEIKPSEILSVSNRIVKSVANKDFLHAKYQPLGKVTISMGLLTCMDASLDKLDIIKQADKALYAAKHSGRNKMVARVVLRKGMEPIDVN